MRGCLCGDLGRFEETKCPHSLLQCVGPLNEWLPNLTRPKPPEVPRIRSLRSFGHAGGYAIVFVYKGDHPAKDSLLDPLLNHFSIFKQHGVWAEGSHLSDISQRSGYHWRQRHVKSTVIVASSENWRAGLVPHEELQSPFLRMMFDPSRERFGAEKKRRCTLPGELGPTLEPAPIAPIDFNCIESHHDGQGRWAIISG